MYLLFTAILPKPLIQVLESFVSDCKFLNIFRLLVYISTENVGLEFGKPELSTFICNKQHVQNVCVLGNFIKFFLQADVSIASSSKHM